MPKIVVITGPPASGKSTLTVKLAENSKKGVAINVDEMRHMIKGGYIAPWKKSAQAQKQKELAIKNTCLIAKNFYKTGFDIFIDDVITSKKEVNIYKKLLPTKFELFLILPKKEVLLKRDSARTERMGKRAEELHDIFDSIKSKYNWTIIDSSNLSIEETITKINTSQH
jgi:adenylate kinase family enzyme